MTLNENGTITQNSIYEPFGKQIPLMDGTNSRLGFISKEKDIESSLGDFGVRKYDEEIGRFTSIDPLWEKYLGWSPYHYCGNNPMMASDPSGMVVVAKSYVAQEAIRNTVSPELQEFVKFSDDGVLDVELLKENMPNDIDVNDNFAALARLAENKQIIDISISNKLSYKNGKGEKFDPYFFSNEHPEGEVLGGITLLPTKYKNLGVEEADAYSVDDNIYVVINKDGGHNFAFAIAHEIFGHVRLALQGKRCTHKSEKNPIPNFLLEWYIENSQKKLKD